MAEPFYCSEQIHIPPELPEILKQFTKAAIKTQPSAEELLPWCAKYFKSMAGGDFPQVSTRAQDGASTAAAGDAAHGQGTHRRGCHGSSLPHTQQ